MVRWKKYIGWGVRRSTRTLMSSLPRWPPARNLLCSATQKLSYVGMIDYIIDNWWSTQPSAPLSPRRGDGWKSQSSNIGLSCDQSPSWSCLHPTAHQSSHCGSGYTLSSQHKGSWGRRMVTLRLAWATQQALAQKNNQRNKTPTPITSCMLVLLILYSMTCFPLFTSQWSILGNFSVLSSSSLHFVLDVWSAF
jgi:hypothetical protein